MMPLKYTTDLYMMKVNRQKQVMQMFDNFWLLFAVKNIRNIVINYLKCIFMNEIYDQLYINIYEKTIRFRDNIDKLCEKFWEDGILPNFVHSDI